MQKDQPVVSIYDRLVYWLVKHNNFSIDTITSMLSAKTQSAMLYPYQLIPKELPAHREFVEKVVEAGRYSAEFFDVRRVKGDTQDADARRRLFKEVQDLIAGIVKIPTSQETYDGVQQTCLAIIEDYKSSWHKKITAEMQEMDPDSAELYYNKNMELVKNLGKNTTKVIGELTDAIKTTARRKASGYNPDVMEVGIPQLDSLSIASYGEFGIFSGGAKTFKTSWQTMMTLRVAKQIRDSGKPGCVVLFSLEIAPKKVGERMAMAESNFPLNSIAAAYGSTSFEEDYPAGLARYDAAVDANAQLPIYMPDITAPTLSDLKYHVNQAERIYGKVNKVVIDYIGCVRFDNGQNCNDLNRRAEMAGEIRDWAKGFRNKIDGTPAVFSVTWENNRGGAEAGFIGTENDLFLTGAYQASSILIARNPFNMNWKSNNKAIAQIKDEDMTSYRTPRGEDGFLKGLFKGVYAEGTPHQMTIEEVVIYVRLNRHGNSTPIRGMAVIPELQKWVNLDSLWDYTDWRWKSVVISGTEYKLQPVEPSQFWWRNINDNKGRN